MQIQYRFKAIGAEMRTLFAHFLHLHFAFSHFICETEIIFCSCFSLSFTSFGFTFIVVCV